VVYFKLNVEEIIKKYCVNKNSPELNCNGQCHLYKSLSADSNDAEKGRYLTTKLIQGFSVVFFQKFGYEWHEFVLAQSLGEYNFVKSKYIQPTLKITTPPPNPKYILTAKF